MKLSRINQILNRFDRVESMNIETDNVIANLNLADIYKNIRYIYKTSMPPTPVKQNLSTNLLSRTLTIRLRPKNIYLQTIRSLIVWLKKT